MDNNYNPDIVTVTDENGCIHTFEELDRVETDSGKYVALLPVFENPDELLEDDGEIILLKVEESDTGDCMLVQIDNQEEYDEVYEIFDVRLSDLFFEE